MQLTLDDEKTKALLTEILVAMLQQKQEIFYELILNALEEVGLANAMKRIQELLILNQVSIVIEQVKALESLAKIKNLSKLKGYDDF